MRFLWGCLSIAAAAVLTACPAWSLTSEEVLALKKAGVGDETIRLMILQEEAARRRDTSDMGVKEVKDAEGRTVIVYSTGPSGPPIDASQREELERAWDMLRRIIIDGRKR